MIFASEMEFTQSDVRKLIYYGWIRGLNGVRIAEEINGALGDSTVTERTCQNWTKQFKDGVFNFEDKERDGRPPTENIEDKIEQHLVENKLATSREIAAALNCSYSTVLRHLHKMGRRYLVWRWVPYKLTPENKNNRMAISGQNLTMLERNNFLNQLITVDECWLFQDNEGNRPGSHNRSWVEGAGDHPHVVKQTPLTTRKQLIIVFWDVKGLILLKVLPRNVSITAEVYCSALDELKDALLANRRRTAGAGFQNFHFLHDNARPHSARITQEKLQELQFTVLRHPPYSPDLSPCDYYLFSPMKAALKGANYKSSEDVITVIKNWFKSKNEEFFRQGIHALPDRWRKCVASGGNYFQRGEDDDNS